MSISTKTTLAFGLFALLCVGLTAALLLDEAQSSTEAAVAERQLLLTRNRAIALRDNLELATGELVRLSRMGHIDLSDGDLEPEQGMLRQARGQSAFFNGPIQLLAADGGCLWTEPPDQPCAGERVLDDESRAALLSTAPSFLYTSEPDGTGTVSLVVPLRNRSGEPVGFLRGVVDLSDDRMFTPVLREDLTPDTRIHVVSADGTLVYGDPASAAELAPYLDEAVVAASRGGQDVRVVGAAGGDGRQLVAWSSVGYGGLALLLAWPGEVLDEPGAAREAKLLGVVGVTLLFALAIGYGISRRVTRPIIALVQLVRGAGADGGGVHIEPARADEIGELYRAFRELISSVRERDGRIQADMEQIAALAATLERRVEERTRELRDAQGALVDAERLAAIGRAGAAISHELRNSLNAINVGIDVLAGSGGDPSLGPVRHQIRDEILRLRSLSDDLLTFARDPRIDRRWASLEDLVTVALAFADDHAQGAEVAVETRVPPEPGRVWIDAHRLQSVLVNLLRNAIDAAAAGKREPRRVRVAADLEADVLVLRVEDSGDGVAEEARRRLFEPFVTTKRTGVGLGLATSERFVRAHGGTIELREGALGGARFEVRIPGALSGEGEERGAA